MCTMGALSTSHSRILLKTLDFAEPGVYAGVFQHTIGSLRVAGIGMWGQSGINAGINEAGVAVMMSYFGSNVGTESRYEGRWHDPRAIYNADVLFTATTATEALVGLRERIHEKGSPVGGTHLIMDQSGTVAVLEHDGSTTAEAVYPPSAGVQLAYGNTAQHGFFKEQERLPEGIRRDRTERAQKMQRALQAMARVPTADAIHVAKRALAAHGDDPDEIGTICVHHLNLPGARANLAGEMETITGMVLDVSNGSIYYSEGNPCGGHWHHLCLS